jgi:hypothetical protein
MGIPRDTGIQCVQGTMSKIPMCLCVCVCVGGGGGGEGTSYSSMTLCVLSQ